jgi:defect-in-organelle-trafficking protein DotC
MNMKRSLLAALSIVIAGTVQAAETAAGQGNGEQDKSIVTLDSLLNPKSKATTGVNNLRAQMIINGARTVGFRGGMISQGELLAQSLRARTDQLDTMFQFAPLVSTNGTIPPVIVETQDLASFSPDQIRTASHVYRIEREERFVSIPPTWRDYLYAGLIDKTVVELPRYEARPQDSSEMAIWRDAVRAGWTDGQKQADAILDANFNRLTRDYTGMILYSVLLQQGMISSTQVVELTQTVAGDGKTLMLDDKVRRLTGKAAFQTNAGKWRARTTPSQIQKKSLPVPPITAPTTTASFP